MKYKNVKLKKSVTEAVTRLPRRVGRQPSLPEVTYYAIVHGFSRGEEWRRKVKMNFPRGENLLVVASVLTQAGYFNKRDAVQEYKDYKANKDTEELFFYGEAEGNFSKGKTGGSVIGDEFNMGFAANQGEAHSNFIDSEPGDDFGGDDW